MRRKFVTTSLDVARAAGVSPAAVSRAFRQGASISPAKRAVVLEVAQQLNYRPNHLAQALLSGRSGLVALVMKHLDNQFYAPLVEMLTAALAADGYRVLLFISDTRQDSDGVVESLLRYRVEAAVMLSTLLSDYAADACSSAGVPVLLINCRIASGRVSTVTADNYGASRIIAAFLLAGAHRRFGMISGIAASSTSIERRTGFTSYLVEHGAGPPIDMSGEYDFATAQAVTRRMLSEADPPDAIFCGNDHMALACIAVARNEFGLRLGEQLSVVGFDDVPMASWSLAALTTFSQPIDQFVGKALSALHVMLDNPGQSTINAVVPGELIVRGSARRPPTGLIKLKDHTVWRPVRRRRV